MAVATLNKRRFLAAAWLVLLAGAAVSPAHADSASSVRKRLEAAAAHFGETALQAQTLRTTAAVTAPGGEYITELRTSREGLLFYRQTKPDGDTLIAMHGGVLSARDDEGNAAAVSPQAAAFVAGHAFHWNLLHAPTLLAGAQIGKAIDFAGERAISLAKTGGDDWPATLYVRARDSLPLGMSILPDGRNDPITIYYRDWISVGGTKAFSRLIIVDSADIYTYQFVRIEFDALQDSDFELPVAK